jgi:hypothetical protein
MLLYLEIEEITAVAVLEDFNKVCAFGPEHGTPFDCAATKVIRGFLFHTNTNWSDCNLMTRGMRVQLHCSYLICRKKIVAEIEISHWVRGPFKILYIRGGGIGRR